SRAGGAARDGATGGREPDPIQRVGARTSAALTYLNTKTVKLNINAEVGPSGLTGANLWVADDKLEWKMVRESGAQPAPPVVDSDKPRLIPVTFVHEVPRDGLYHFMIVVKNPRESSRPDPKKGEP